MRLRSFGLTANVSAAKPPRFREAKDFTAGVFVRKPLNWCRRRATLSAAKPPRFREANGFTLIELMVAVAVMLVLTTVFVFQFRAFDSTTILRARTNEAAQAVRIAQGYATAIRGVGEGNEERFSHPYGTSFTRGSNEISIFYYPGDAALARNDSDARIIDLQTLGERHIVSDLCVEYTDGSEECGLSQLDISFKRPETRAYFYGEVATVPLGASGIAFARIKVRARDGEKVGTVEVGTTGYVATKFE